MSEFFLASGLSVGDGVISGVIGFMFTIGTGGAGLIAYLLFSIPC
jgi:hypothetical protein